MARKAPVNGAERRATMGTRAPRNTKEQWQLELLLNAERINRLDARSRAAVVNLLACMLLEAARADEREVAGEA
jgi:hypothetical protein